MSGRIRPCWSSKVGPPANLDVARMLAVHRMPEGPQLTPYSPPLTVTPREIFADYDRVMALLGKERTGEIYNTDSDSDGASESPSGSHHDPDAESYDNSDVHDDDDDEEYTEEPRPRLPVRNATRTSGRATPQSVVRRRGRRTQPYDLGNRRPHAAHTLGPNPSNRCPYVSPSGKQCNETTTNGTILDWTKKRHWSTVHLFKEAKAMVTGALRVGEGTLIRSKSELDAILPRVPKCPMCHELSTRGDALRRHMKNLHGVSSQDLGDIMDSRIRGSKSSVSGQSSTN